MQTYYLSNNGNDKNTGLSPDAPYKSIERINSLDIKPGDKILLKRGDKFTGSILVKTSGTKEIPIIISSWGEGNRPVLSGSTPVTAKGSKGASVYRCGIGKPVKQVFINDHWLDLARYPSKGFFGIDGGDKKSLKDRELLLQDVDCTGATARIRAVNWQYEIARVAKHECDTLIFEKNMIYRCQKDYGYFLDNKLEFMTEPGEWYYDDQRSGLYFIPPEGIEVKKMSVEACIIDAGIQITNANHIIIEGIRFEKFFLAGILGQSGSSNIRINGCEFNKIHQDGISLESGTSHYIISNNDISDIKGRGIACLDTHDSVIRHNQVKRVGLFPGYGYDGVNNGTGIAILKTELVYSISENTLKALEGQIPHELSSQLKECLNIPFADEKFLIAHLEECLSGPELKPYIAKVAKQVRNELGDVSYKSENNYIGYNKVEKTGLHGIRLDGKNHLCEYNTVRDSLLYMNDGSSIYSWAQNYDYSTGTVIRRNIIQNSIGNVVATPDFHRFAHGIYIDNKCTGFTVADNIITGTTWGILVNDEARDHTITGNIVFDNDIGLAFSEYFMPGTLRGCKASGNILFARFRNQRAMFIESRISPDFDPVMTDHNFYGSSYYTFPIKKLTFRGKHRIWEEFDLESWQEESGKDMNSLSFAPPDPEARPRSSYMIINDSLETRIFPIDNTIRDHYDIYGKKSGDEVKLEAHTAVIIVED